MQNAGEEPRTPKAHRRVSARAVDPRMPLAEPWPGRRTLYPRRLSDRGPWHEINHRCLELLVQAARTDRPGTFPLVNSLRDLLRNMTPEAQARAARWDFLLVDLRFRDGQGWRRVKDPSTHRKPPPASEGAFPRAAGLLLAPATLHLAWQTVQVAPYEGFLMGMTTDVSDAIGELGVTDIYPVAERLFRHVRPRWEDRPAVWRQLLVSAQTDDVHSARDFSLYALQLLTADLMSPGARSRIGCPKG
jgi:hypothetical protein